MLESLPSYEKKEGAEKQILKALELTRNQEHILTQKIEKNNGTIRIFIHPYYDNPKMTYGWVGKYQPEKRERMQQTMERFISNTDENQSPLFIFEEAEKITDLNQKLKDTLGRDIYSIPTMKDRSTPKIGITYTEDWLTEESLSWAKVRLKFLKWGVKKIAIGGQSLAIDFNNEIEGSNPWEASGCVGSAINYLEDDFEIEVSHFSYPTDRKEYNHYRNFKNSD